MSRLELDFTAENFGNHDMRDLFLAATFSNYNATDSIDDISCNPEYSGNDWKKVIGEKSYHVLRFYMELCNDSVLISSPFFKLDPQSVALVAFGALKGQQQLGGASIEWKQVRAVVDNAMTVVNMVETRLSMMNYFLTRVFGFCTTTDSALISKRCNEFIRRTACASLSEVRKQLSVLGSGDAFIERLGGSACLHWASKSFCAWFLREVQRTGSISIKAMDLLEQILPKSLHAFSARLKELEDYESLECVSIGDELLDLLEVNDVSEEINTLRKLEYNISLDVVSYLDNVSRIRHSVAEVRLLSRAVVLFKVDVDQAVSLAMDTFLSRVDSKATLGPCLRAFTWYDSLVSPLNDCQVAIIAALDGETLFVEFMREMSGDRSESLNSLVDAVEEYSETTDTTIPTINSLVTVQRALRELVVPDRPLAAFLKTLDIVASATDLPLVTTLDHLQRCKGHIVEMRDIYRGLKDRSEVTRETLRRAARSGVYRFELANGVCKIVLEYNSSDNNEASTKSLSLEELIDLQCRAQLIANTKDLRKNVAAVDDRDRNLCHDFIEDVNVIENIVLTYSKLHCSGHLTCEDFLPFKLSKRSELKPKRDTLQTMLDEWVDVFAKTRRSHKYINYFYSNQIRLLFRFFCGNSDKQEQCHRLLQSVFRDVQLHCLHRESFKLIGKRTTLEECLRCTVEGLEDLFRSAIQRKRAVTFTDAPKLPAGEHLRQGELFVAQVKEGLVINVILSLFVQNQEALPEVHQLLICQPDTSWEQVESFLWRSIGDERNFNVGLMYCIANADVLSAEIQEKLSGFIFKLLKDDSVQGNQVRHRGKLVILTSRANGQRILHDFRLFQKHDVKGLSNEQAKSLLSSVLSETLVVTSDFAGQGKSETIKRLCCGRSKKRLVSMLIAGHVTYGQLTKAIRDLPFTESQNLHIDVLEVTNPSVLNNWLFELLVVGGVMSGDLYISLPPRTAVYIEIANSMANDLFEKLSFCHLLPPKHLEWDFERVVISQDPASAMQIVCQYLKYIQDGALDDTVVTLQENGKERNTGISQHECRQLLQRDFRREDMTFNVLGTFVKVLANQLVKFSQSSLFDPQHLTIAVNTKAVRTHMFRSLFDMSKDFAMRSVNWSKEGQFSCMELFPDDVTSRMVERFGEMNTWSKRRHLVVLFHDEDRENFSPVYLKREDLTDSISTVLGYFAQQRGVSWDDDLISGEHEDLVKLLEKMFWRSSRCGTYPDYILTRDNVLKAAMILLRIQANVPVIIMGETGCGKTSLVHFLANLLGAKLFALNCHSGVHVPEIEDFVGNVVEEALANKNTLFWAFLDEINTCSHTGLLADVVVHRVYRRNSLPTNVAFLAACNPYRFSQKPTAEIGLPRDQPITSKLAYTVNPLPECMIDYVWDYGALQCEEEGQYINKMLDGLDDINTSLVADLIQESQEYVRRVTNSRSSCSLRDVNRCKVLIEWFLENQLAPDQHLGVDKRVRAVILGLFVNYYCRLLSTQQRNSYYDEIVSCFNKHGHSISLRQLQDVTRHEQFAYLQQMVVRPKGIAANTALLENVFVLTLCVLTKTPLLMVGKPGCSKSLSMQLLRSNLRAGDSASTLFKSKPRVVVVPYQGSESSESKGIEAVFKKAESRNSDNVIPVVLLDEVGLAERSKSNPLKVLHSLLEPRENGVGITSYDVKPLNVAFVGISNWELDAAKMNRAIHLARPEPDLDDLVETGKAISKELCGTCPDNYIQLIAEGYVQYMEKQRKPMSLFHGLRDYYSLVKEFSRVSCCPGSSLEVEKRKYKAICRNFGGLDKSELDPCEILAEVSFTPKSSPAVLELVRENLSDPNARHLMLIGNGDSALNILVGETSIEPLVLVGSQFDNDVDEQSEQYRYKVLSKIILYMETGKTVVLKDLDSVYGSLYDLLNQSYTTVVNNMYCRVAHGPNASPLCLVHPRFRCIVLIEHTVSTMVDPPFLNRFEKQLLRFKDVLSSEQTDLVADMESLVKATLKLASSDEEFSVADGFVGMHCDLLPSLLHFFATCHGSERSFGDCRDETWKNFISSGLIDRLLRMATMDYIVRIGNSELYSTRQSLAQELQERYFRMSHLLGLEKFVQSSIKTNNALRCIIVTFSSIHRNIKDLVSAAFDVDVVRLSNMKSEEDLIERLNQFWASPRLFMAVQCDPYVDDKHMIYLKFTFDRVWKERIAANPSCQKHVCVIVHIDRASSCYWNSEAETHDHFTTSPTKWQFDFLCGWELVFMDQLEKPALRLNCAHATKPIDQLQWHGLIRHRGRLSRCLELIKWPKNLDGSGNSLRDIQNELLANSLAVETLEGFVRENLDRGDRSHVSNWLNRLAMSRKQLVIHQTLQHAAVEYIERLYRDVMARLLYVLARDSLLYLITAAFSDCETSIEESRMPREVVQHLMNTIVVKEVEKLPDAYSGQLVLKQMPVPLGFPYSLRCYEKMKEGACALLSQTAERHQIQGPPSEMNQIQRRTFLDILEIWSEPAWRSYEKDFFYLSSQRFHVPADTLRWVYGKLTENSGTNSSEGTMWSESSQLMPYDLHWNVEANELLMRELTAIAATTNTECSRAYLDESRTGLTYFPYDMVNRVCSKLLSGIEQSLQIHQLKDWHHLARQVLSRISTIDEYLKESPLAVVALSILADFVVSVALPYGLPDSPILELSSTLASIGEGHICSSDAIGLLHGIAFNSGKLLTRGSEARHRAAISAFLHNALALLLEDDNYDRALSLLSASYPSPAGYSKIQDLIGGFVSKDNAVQYLLSVDEAYDSPFLQTLEDYLRNVYDDNDGVLQPYMPISEERRTGIVRLDGYLATTCCAVMQSVFRDLIRENLVGDTECRKTLAGAFDVIGNRRHRPVLVIMAVGWIRAFLEHYGSLLGEDMLNTSMIAKHRLQLVNHFLQDETRDDLNLKEQMRYYVLRQAKARCPLSTMAQCLRQKDYTESYPWTQISSCRQIPFDEPCGVCPFGMFPKYSQIKTALKHAVNRNKNDFYRYLEVAADPTAPESQDMFMSVVANIAYQLTFQGRTDGEDAHYKLFVNKLFRKGQKISSTPLANVLRALLEPQKSSPFHCDNLKTVADIHMASVRVVLLLNFFGSSEMESPFCRYMTDLKSACNDYILTNYWKEEDVSEDSLAGEALDFELSNMCTCPSKYILAGEGYLPRANICPECEKTIALSILLTQTPSNAMFAKGYSVKARTSLLLSGTGLDAKNQVAFRILHCIVHIALMDGFIFKFTDDHVLVSFVTGSTGDGHIDSNAVVSYLDSVIREDWLVLKQFLQLSHEDLGLLLNRITRELAKSTDPVMRVSHIASHVQRAEWEQKFYCLVSPVLQNLKPEIRKERRRLSTGSEGPETAVLNAIYEIDVRKDDLSRVGESNVACCGRRFFRYTASPSREDLYALFAANSELRKTHALLWVVLCYHPYLGVIKELRSLLAWTNEVATTGQFKLSRSDAMETEPETFIRDFYKDMERKDRENILNKFKAFVTSWQRVTSLGLIDLTKSRSLTLPPNSTKMERLASKAICYSCLEPTGTGEVVYTILRFLCDIQNSFLQRLEDLGECEDSCPAIAHLHPDRVSLQLCDVDVDVINYESDWNEVLLERALVNPEYGHGDEVEYDLWFIEKTLVKDLVTGRPYLELDKETVQPFMFEGALLHDFSGLMVMAEKQILGGLEPVSTELTEALKDPTVVDTHEHRTILTSLEIVLHHINRNDAVDGRVTIDAYFQDNDWLKDELPTALFKNSEQLKKELCVKHVVDLYLVIEELQAARVISALSKSYKKKFGVHLAPHLKDISKETPAFVKALLLFMFRRLTDDQTETFSPTRPLADFLRFFDWPENVSRQQFDAIHRSLPKELLLESVYEVYQLLSKPEQVRLQVLRSTCSLFMSNCLSQEPVIPKPQARAGKRKKKTY